MKAADALLSVENSSGSTRRARLAIWVSLIALLLTLLLPTQTTPVSAWSAPRTVYLPQTGQTLDQLFLDLWRNAGGASAYGYPISPEIEFEDGHVEQYLQYARFEYWPEGNEDGLNVVVSDLGYELRPITVRRTSIGSMDVARETLAEAKAWIPYESDPAPDDKSFVFSDLTGHTIRGAFLSFWYNSGGSDYLGYPLTEEYVKRGVTYQVFERGQLQWTETDGVTMVPIGQNLANKYQIDQSPVPQGDIPTYDEALFIPPGPAYGVVDPSKELWVEVNLSWQYMYVYSGNTPILETYISSGRSGFDTPTGTFYVGTMYAYDDMEGIAGGEYYFVSQVPDVMYFTNQGHALHGAYWHNNFGSPMSHGCVNLPMDVAEWLFSYAYVGMRIWIHY